MPEHSIGPDMVPRRFLSTRQCGKLRTWLGEALAPGREDGREDAKKLPQVEETNQAKSC